MERHVSVKSSTKFSLVGFFAILTFTVTLPIALMLSQERQDLRGKAAEPTPTPIAIQSNDPKDLSGYVYHDTNKNGERDQGEKAYPNVALKIIQRSANLTEDGAITLQDITQLTTDTNGYFKVTVSSIPPEADLLIKVVLPTGYKTINTNPVIIQGATLQTKENIHFGLFPISLN